MLLLLLAYLGGVLTILSPCILPVLPFVFSAAGGRFARSALPLLAGMALMFAAVATLAAVGGAWVVAANQWGRWLALGLLAVSGLALLVPGVADRLARPLVAAGNRLAAGAQAGDARVGGMRAGSGSTGNTHADSASAGNGPRPAASFVLGIATGLLWAPCAGPILGLVLTGAALQGASVQTSLLLLAYAAGAATSLAGALLVGGRLYAAMKRSLGAGEWLRRGLGAAMLAGVAAISLGWDTGVLAQLSTASTNSLEQALLDRYPGGNIPGRPAAMQGQPLAMQARPTAMQAQPGVMRADPEAMQAQSGMMMQAQPEAMQAQPGMMMQGQPQAMQAAGAMQAQPQAMRSAAGVPAPLPVEGQAPPLDGAVQWLNGPPLSLDALRGKVVLVDFWTYSCINCLRALPYVRAWADKYRDQGLVVVGVHAPEFAFERDLRNVRKAVDKLGIGYPVAVDNDYAIWRAYNNSYWPAHYFIDAQGRVRHHHFGEGEYDRSERVIQQLLREAGAAGVPGALADVRGEGIQQAADMDSMRSPETYLGYERAEHFASPGGARAGETADYAAPDRPMLNQWGLAGRWEIGPEAARLDAPGGRIVFRFQARDLHLVLGPGADGRPVRFRVLIDGQPPGAAHGVDVAPDGSGTVDGQRLYQLVRQDASAAARTFSIEFLDPGVSAYAFTFG